MTPELAPYTETIKFLGGAFLGAKLRMDAQNAQLRNEEYKVLGKVALAQAGEANTSHNDAQGRGSHVDRTILGTIIISVAFLGLLYAMVKNKDVLIETTRPLRNWLWGAWQTGGQTEFVGGNGFVLPSYVEESVSAVVGFTFGVGAATVYSKVKKA